MLKKKIVLRFILGLKIRQLRIKRELSLKELADLSDLSVSYLNEIEKGKKYPKIEKLAALAQSLSIDLGELVSFKTGRNLHPLLKFLESDMVEKVPLELFGLNESDVVDLMGHDPEKFASFVLTVLQISRSFDVKMGDVYSAALRSYIEAHDNYFPELEKITKKTKTHLKLGSESILFDQLKSLLKKEHNYEVDEKTLGENPLFSETKFLVKHSAPATIYLNPKLKENQKTFCLAKELGHLVLGTKKEIENKNLGEMLEDFKTSYFAGALLLEEKQFSDDLKTFFSLPKFEADSFLALLTKYKVSPEVLFHRLTQVLPSHFKVNELFFLSLMTKVHEKENYVINNELHLSQLHSPHGVRMNENYCRRWVAIKSLKQFKNNMSLEHSVLGQISVVLDGTEYFSISLATKSSLEDHSLNSLTIGFLVNDELKNALKFLGDKNLKRIHIGQTCERCPLSDCEDRVVPASIYQKEIEREQRQKAMVQLTK
jgi:transcriptional regulator with XRE-family HTH domain/predicted transcriptional regulator